MKGKGLLGIAGVPGQFGYVARNDDGADEVIAGHLNLVLAVELQEVGSGVGKLQRRFTFAIGTAIGQFIGRYGVNVVNDAVERSFETIEHAAGECE